VTSGISTNANRLKPAMPGMHRMGSRPPSSLPLPTSVAPGEMASKDGAMSGLGGLKAGVSRRDRLGAAPICGFSTLKFAVSGFFSEISGWKFTFSASDPQFQPFYSKKEPGNSGKEAGPAGNPYSPAGNPAEILRFRWERRRRWQVVLKINPETAKKNLGISGLQTPVDRAQACPSKHPDGYREVPF
jgi:hypothetical protein